MLVAGHTSALRRRSEIRAMPEIEKPPAKPVDIYCFKRNNGKLIIVYKKSPTRNSSWEIINSDLNSY